MTAASSEELAVDHVRLFVNAPGGVAAPPYASWYLDGQVRGPSCTWVERAYRAQGLEHDPGAGEPADYIAAELEFMYFLVRHEIAARTTGDTVALRATLTAETDFVCKHLARWVPTFVGRARTARPHPTIEAAISLLDSLLEDEVQTLSAPESKGIANLSSH